VHENGKGLLAYSRGRPGKDRSCVTFSSSLDLNKKIQDLKNDFLLHNEIKMMLLVSITTNNMIRYVSMYPEVWFLDCTAGELGYANACLSIWLYIFVINNLVYFSLYTILSGTNQQKKELFVMAVRSASGDTLPGNLTIIPSAQKWVFHAIYQHAFPHLYSSEVCSRNRLVLTDEDTSQFKPFESLISTTHIFNLSKVMICTFHGI
jgi:hypothetical protein